MSLEQPLLLAALLSITGAGLWLAWRRKRSLRPTSTLVLLVAAVLAGGPLYERSRPPRLRIFLLDASASFEAALPGLRGALQSAVDDLSGGDRAALIVFGGEPRVSILPCPPARFREGLTSAPFDVRAGTDIAVAIDVGLSLEAGSRRRELLLISDGISTTGEPDLGASTGRLEARMSPLFTFCPPGLAEPDVCLGPLVGPTRVAPGAAVELELRIAGEGGRRVALAVAAQDDAGRVALERRAELRIPLDRPLTHRLSLPLEAAGLYRISARLRPLDSAPDRPDNNHAERFVMVGAERVALVLSERPGAAASLARAAGLEALCPALDSLTPERFTRLLGRDVELVVIDNLPETRLRAVTPALRAALEERGCGLLVLGGRRSFGLGAYSGAPLEGLLPLRSTPPGAPREGLALTLAVDASASMVERYPRALEGGVRAALALLGEDDERALLAFAGGARFRSGWRPIDDLEADLAALRRLDPQGPTELAFALRALLDDLHEARATRRLAVLVSDGEAELSERERAALRRRAGSLPRPARGAPPAELRLFHIGLGPGFETLARLATELSGPGLDARAIGFEDAGAALTAKLRSSVAKRRGDIAEQRFVVRPTKAGLARGLEKSEAAIDGLCLTRPSTDAELLAVAGPSSLPLLARRELGLGQCVALATSVGGWGRALRDSDAGRSLLRSAFELALPKRAEGWRLAAERRGDRLIVTAESDVDVGEPPAMEVSVTAADGAASRRVMIPVSPGRLRAELRITAGPHDVTAFLDKGATSARLGSVSVASASAVELADLEPRLSALERLSGPSGGRLLPRLPSAERPLPQDLVTAPQSARAPLAAACLALLLLSLAWPELRLRRSRHAHLR